MPEDKTRQLIWRANYNDGSSLVEKEQNGKEHLFKEIDQTKLISFDIIKPPKDAKEFAREEVSFNTKNMKGETIQVTFTTYNTELKPLLRVTLDSDKRLIFRRRQQQHAGQHSAIFGDDPNQYGSVEKIPKCEKCQKYIPNIKNVPYPLQFPQQTIILVGWQQTIGGKNTQAVNYIFPDGSMELAGQWGTDAIHKEALPYVAEK